MNPPPSLYLVYSLCCHRWWNHPPVPGRAFCPFCGREVRLEIAKIGTEACNTLLAEIEANRRPAPEPEPREEIVDVPDA